MATKQTSVGSQLREKYDAMTPEDQGQLADSLREAIYHLAACWDACFQVAFRQPFMPAIPESDSPTSSWTKADGCVPTGGSGGTSTPPWRIRSCRTKEQAQRISIDRQGNTLPIARRWEMLRVCPPLMQRPVSEQN